MTNLITEARELCDRYHRQKHIPVSMLDKARELCDALEKAEQDIERLTKDKQNEFDLATGYYNKWQKAKAEVERLREALEVAKRGYVDCMSAERQSDGKCLGYGRGENDDEPCEQCSICPMCSANEPETKTIQEWAALDGVKVYDPDGFDRTDPLIWERKITKAEYDAGIMRCTVVPLPAPPT